MNRRNYCRYRRPLNSNRLNSNKYAVSQLREEVRDAIHEAVFYDMYDKLCDTLNGLSNKLDKVKDYNWDWFGADPYHPADLPADIDNRIAKALMDIENAYVDAYFYNYNEDDYSDIDE